MRNCLAPCKPPIVSLHRESLPSGSKRAQRQAAAIAVHLARLLGARHHGQDNEPVIFGYRRKIKKTAVCLRLQLATPPCFDRRCVPGRRHFRVSAGSVARSTTSSLLAGGAARAPSMGATKAARLAARAAATPATAKTLAISVLLHDWVPLATTACGEGEAGGAVFLRDVATGNNGFSCFRPRSRAECRRRRRFERLVKVL